MGGRAWHCSGAAPPGKPHPDLSKSSAGNTLAFRVWSRVHDGAADGFAAVHRNKLRSGEPHVVAAGGRARDLAEVGQAEVRGGGKQAFSCPALEVVQGVQEGGPGGVGPGRLEALDGQVGRQPSVGPVEVRNTGEVLVLLKGALLALGSWRLLLKWDLRYAKNLRPEQPAPRTGRRAELGRSRRPASVPPA